MGERCACGPLAVGGGGGDTGVGGDPSRGCLWGELLLLRLGRGLDGWCRLASPQPHLDAHGVPETLCPPGGAAWAQHGAPTHKAHLVATC